MILFWNIISPFSCTIRCIRYHTFQALKKKEWKKTMCVYISVYIGALWCIYFCFSWSVLFMCCSGICIRSSTGVANPKVLHFANLTEALQSKLYMYLISSFVHNRSTTIHRKLSSWQLTVAFLFLVGAVCNNICQSPLNCLLSRFYLMHFVLKWCYKFVFENIFHLCISYLYFAVVALLLLLHLTKSNKEFDSWTVHNEMVLVLNTK